MASIREMREHINSIESIGQMTRALQAVSASRVKMATKLEAESYPYSKAAHQIMQDLAESSNTLDLHPAFQYRENTNKALIIFISADRGLAGTFPVNVFRELIRLEKQLAGYEIGFITVGKKGRDMLVRRKKNIIADFSGFSNQDIKHHEVWTITDIVLDAFMKDEQLTVYLVYTKYHSVSNYLPKTELLLPLTQVFPGADSTKKLVSTIDKDFIFEGNPTRTMQQFVRRVLSRTIYHAILGSRASEHSARMIAMSNATDNAEALQTQLELEYNKVRQQSITNDMLDIVSGANAQKQGA